MKQNNLSCIYESVPKSFKVSFPRKWESIKLSKIKTLWIPTFLGMIKRQPFWSILIYVFLLMFTSCKNDNFSPYGNLENNYGAFCILDSRQKIQFVGLQKVYFPSGNSNLDSNGKVNGGFSIYIIDGSGVKYQFNDTTIDGITNRNILYNPALKLKRGTRYRLSIKNDILPERYSDVGIPSIQNVDVAVNLSHDGTIIFGCIARFTLKAGGSNYNRIGMYIKYRNEKGSSMIEVPAFMEYPPDIKVYPYQVDFYNLIDYLDQIMLTYPSIREKFSSSVYMKSQLILGAYYETVSYPLLSIPYALHRIGQNSDPKNITIEKAYFITYSIEKNLYDYLVAEKGFEDPYSIRLDKPFWSSFTGINNNAIGVFGGITVDTVTFKIPPEVISYYQFNDAQ